MAMYDFACLKCKKGVTLQFGMNDDKGRDGAECPKCKSKLKRIYTSPAAIIKNSLGTSADFKLTGKDQHFIDVEGKSIRLNFLDHGKNSGIAENSMTKKLKGARMDEKTGRQVVDVVSNVPDPLGRLERSKQAGNMSSQKFNVNQKYKMRKGK
jgi:putative FmdB family regulatory protein